jgi:hypothetical protein
MAKSGGAHIFERRKPCPVGASLYAEESVRTFYRDYVNVGKSSHSGFGDLECSPPSSGGITEKSLRRIRQGQHHLQQRCSGVYHDGSSKRARGTRALAANVSASEIYKTWAEDVPLQRLARPEEVADAIIWLASDRASYVTGQTITVDGGKYRGVA